MTQPPPNHPLASAEAAQVLAAFAHEARHQLADQLGVSTLPGVAVIAAAEDPAGIQIVAGAVDVAPDVMDAVADYLLRASHALAAQANDARARLN